MVDVESCYAIIGIVGQEIAESRNYGQDFRKSLAIQNELVALHLHRFGARKSPGDRMIN